MASADAEEPRPLWWMAHSSVPSLAPTPSLNKGKLPVMVSFCKFNEMPVFLQQTKYLHFSLITDVLRS